MNILAIDTALAACSVAVLSDERPFSCVEPMARGHAEALMPMVAGVLAEAGMGFGAIDRFAVTIGPGTFTGVRVGVAAVRGMALATGRSAIGIPTLEAIAATHLAAPRLAEPGAARPLAVVMDARRDEVYAQSFAADGTPLDEARAVSVDVLAASLPPEIETAVGTAAALLADAATRIGRVVPAAGSVGWPDPVVLARLASAREAGPPPSPLYLRPPDARPQAAARLARA